MKNKRKYNVVSLTNLYANQILKKGTSIIFFISLIFIIISIYFISNPWAKTSEYLEALKDFHNLYLTQSILLIQIFNSILVTTFAISITLHSLSFDTLFVSYLTRKEICFAKLIPLAILCINIALFEWIVIYGIGYMKFSRFLIDLECLKVIIYIFISLFFELLISICLTTALPNIFVPMFNLLFHIVLKVIFNNNEILRNIFNALIPILQVNEEMILLKYPIISGLWVIIFLFLYISIYAIKDLK